jgi:histidine triad (HIT) family protein
MNDCIFCKLSKNEMKSDRVYENDNFFVIFDINPLVIGHALIISKKHFANILEMPQTLGQEFLDAVKKTAELLLPKYKAEGFNLGCNMGKAAGQLVHHVHMHFLPRKEGDGFRFGA